MRSCLAVGQARNEGGVTPLGGGARNTIVQRIKQLGRCERERGTYLEQRDDGDDDDDDDNEIG